MDARLLIALFKIVKKIQTTYVLNNERLIQRMMEKRNEGKLEIITGNNAGEDFSMNANEQRLYVQTNELASMFHGSWQKTQDS